MAGTQIFTRTLRDGYRTEIEAAGFHLTADEPADVGGTGAGPTPYDLLLAALGACTGMTLRMYAARKGWPLEEVAIELHEPRDYAADCERCEEPEARIKRVNREITLHGALDDEQRARLMLIAERCPVQKALGSTLRVETTLVPAAPPAV